MKAIDTKREPVTALHVEMVRKDQDYVAPAICIFRRVPFGGEGDARGKSEIEVNQNSVQPT